LTLECHVKEVRDDATSRDCYHLIADIVGILVDDKYVGEDGYPEDEFDLPRNGTSDLYPARRNGR